MFSIQELLCSWFFEYEVRTVSLSLALLLSFSPKSINESHPDSLRVRTIKILTTTTMGCVMSSSAAVRLAREEHRRTYEEGEIGRHYEVMRKVGDGDSSSTMSNESHSHCPDKLGAGRASTPAAAPGPAARCLESRQPAPAEFPRQTQAPWDRATGP